MNCIMGLVKKAANSAGRTILCGPLNLIPVSIDLFNILLTSPERKRKGKKWARAQLLQQISRLVHTKTYTTETMGLNPKQSRVSHFLLLSANRGEKDAEEEVERVQKWKLTGERRVREIKVVFYRDQPFQRSRFRLKHLRFPNRTLKFQPFSVETR